MTEGAPELPQMNRLIALPAGGRATVDGHERCRPAPCASPTSA